MHQNMITEANYRFIFPHNQCNKHCRKAHKQTVVIQETQFTKLLNISTQTAPVYSCAQAYKHARCQTHKFFTHRKWATSRLKLTLTLPWAWVGQFLADMALMSVLWCQYWDFILQQWLLWRVVFSRDWRHWLPYSLLCTMIVIIAYK